MAVQQNKVSPSRRNKRRSHDALRPVNRSECPNCGELKLPHHVCPACGHYHGLSVVQKIEEDIDDAE